MRAGDLHRNRRSIPAGLQHGANPARSLAAHRHPHNATRQTLFLIHDGRLVPLSQYRDRLRQHSGST
jgi:hypothetical protein